jgi:hypothetical protein
MHTFFEFQPLQDTMILMKHRLLSATALFLSLSFTNAFILNTDTTATEKATTTFGLNRKGLGSSSVVIYSSSVTSRLQAMVSLPPESLSSSSSSTSSTSFSTMDTSATYTNDELKAALGAFTIQDSQNPNYHARHIFGYKDVNHKLSILHTITATVLLDYQPCFEAQEKHVISMEDLKKYAQELATQYSPILTL